MLLVLAVLAGRFTGYLADAAAGRITGSAAALLLGLRLPEFLALLIPLALLVAMALVLARAVADGEMLALRAVGLSTRALVVWATCTALPAALVVAVCAWWLAPASERNLSDLLMRYGGLDEFDAIRPGRWHSVGGEQVTLWAAAASPDGRHLSGIFIAEQDSPHVSIAGHMTITMAARANQYVDAGTGSRFLVLRNGTRQDGTPGELGFRTVEFEQLGERIDTGVIDVRRDSTASLPMQVLLASRNPAHIAEWQWRVLLPALAPFAALLVLAVTPTSARSGRLAVLAVLAAIATYLLAFFLISAVRDIVATGSGDAKPYLPLVVTGLYVLPLACLYLRERPARSGS